MTSRLSGLSVRFGATPDNSGEGPAPAAVEPRRGARSERGLPAAADGLARLAAELDAMAARSVDDARAQTTRLARLESKLGDQAEALDAIRAQLADAGPSAGGGDQSDLLAALDVTAARIESAVRTETDQAGLDARLEERFAAFEQAFLGALSERVEAHVSLAVETALERAATLYGGRNDDAADERGEAEERAREIAAAAECAAEAAARSVADEMGDANRRAADMLAEMDARLRTIDQRQAQTAAERASTIARITASQEAAAKSQQAQAQVQAAAFDALKTDLKALAGRMAEAHAGATMEVRRSAEAVAAATSDAAARETASREALTAIGERVQDALTALEAAAAREGAAREAIDAQGAQTAAILEQIEAASAREARADEAADGLAARIDEIGARIEDAAARDAALLDAVGELTSRSEQTVAGIESLAGGDEHEQTLNAVNALHERTEAISAAVDDLRETTARPTAPEWAAALNETVAEEFAGVRAEVAALSEAGASHASSMLDALGASSGIEEARQRLARLESIVQKSSRDGDAGAPAALADFATDVSAKLDAIGDEVCGLRSTLAAIEARPVANVSGQGLPAGDASTSHLDQTLATFAAERRSLRRIQTGFQLLLKDLTGEADALRDAVASIVDDARGARAAIEGARAMSVEQPLDDAAMRTREPFDAERQGMRRIQTGFQLLLKDLTGEADALRTAVASIADDARAARTAIEEASASISATTSQDAAPSIEPFVEPIAEPIDDAAAMRTRPAFAAERQGLQRVQTGFQLLLRDLTHEADAFRTAVADIKSDARALRTDDQANAVASAAVASPASISRPAAATTGAPLSGERESFERIIVGFRMLMRTLGRETEQLSSLVAAARERFAAVDEVDAAESSEAADRLSLIADILAEQVLNIEPTIVTALSDQRGVGLPAAGDDADSLEQTLRSLREIGGEMKTAVEAVSALSTSTNYSSLPDTLRETASTVATNVDMFLDVASALSRQIDRITSTKSDPDEEKKPTSRHLFTGALPGS